MLERNAFGVAWWRCLELALEGWASGSLAIAAVICSGRGEILSEGRNWLYDSRGPLDAIKGNLVAHAELNAIARLPTRYRSDKTVRLFTSVEPCPMCMGAIVMSPVRWVCAATRDPWAGSFRLLEEDGYMGGKKIHTEFVAAMDNRDAARLVSLAGGGRS